MLDLGDVSQFHQNCKDRGRWENNISTDELESLCVGEPLKAVWCCFCVIVLSTLPCGHCMLHLETMWLLKFAPKVLAVPLLAHGLGNQAADFHPMERYQCGDPWRFAADQCWKPDLSEASTFPPQHHQAGVSWLQEKEFVLVSRTKAHEFGVLGTCGKLGEGDHGWRPRRRCWVIVWKWRAETKEEAEERTSEIVRGICCGDFARWLWKFDCHVAFQQTCWCGYPSRSFQCAEMFGIFGSWLLHMCRRCKEILQQEW